jgi:O-antigen ligase
MKGSVQGNNRTATEVLDNRTGIFDRSLVAAAVLLFMVAAGNGARLWWGGLVPSIVLAIAIVYSVPRRDLAIAAVPLNTLVPVAALAALCITAFASTLLVARSASSFVHWLSAYFSPVVILLAFVVRRFDTREVRTLWIVMTLGALVPLGLGLVHYLREWGVPSGAELLLSRYDLERMDGYSRATFGNTGSTAAYLCLLLPGWVALAIRSSLSGRARWLFVIALGLGFAHVLIVQSRTLFLLMLLMLPVIFFYFRYRVMVGAMALIAIIVVVIAPVLSAVDRFTELTVGALRGVVTGQVEDTSLNDRLEAMRYAWQTLLDHPAFGVGPANTLLVNPYTSAHQSWLQQGSEVGMLGLLLFAILTSAVLLRFAWCTALRTGPDSRDHCFVLLLGPVTYLLYGTIANVPLASTVTNSWIGLFAAQFAMSIWVGVRRDPVLERRVTSSELPGVAH